MSSPSRQGRPRTVTITLWGVFLFGVWNSGRAVALVSQSAALLQLNIDPLFSAIRAATAVLWAYLFLFEWVALRRERPFVRLAIPITIGANGLYEMLLLLTFATAPQTISLLALLGYTAATWFTAWALNAE